MKSLDEQFGRGVDRRAEIRMSDAEIAEFLRSARTLSLASFNPDGTIHLVAMWYVVLDDKITFWTKGKSQKAQNLRRNPSLTCMVEEGETYEALRGVQIVGTAEIIQGHDELLEIGKRLFEEWVGHYTDEQLPMVEKMVHKRVVVIVHPTRVASWDHSKL